MVDLSVRAAGNFAGGAMTDKPIPWKRWPEEQPDQRNDEPVIYYHKGQFDMVFAGNFYDDEGEPVDHEPFYWIYETELLETLPSEGRKYWAAMERSAEIVCTWPDWKTGRDYTAKAKKMSEPTDEELIAEIHEGFRNPYRDLGENQKRITIEVCDRLAARNEEIKKLQAKLELHNKHKAWIKEALDNMNERYKSYFNDKE